MIRTPLTVNNPLFTISTAFVLQKTIPPNTAVNNMAQTYKGALSENSSLRKTDKTDASPAI